MYHPISIQPVSPSQIRKLIYGQPVRVRHGSGMSIHVSPDQHKRIMRAHMRGKAHTLTMDPYQAQQHGSGLLGDLAKKAIHHVKGHIKANIPQAERFVKAEIQKYGKKGMDMAENKLVHLGLSPELSHRIAEDATGRMVRGAEHLANRGFHEINKQVGGKISLKSIGRTINKGIKKIGHELSPMAHQIQSTAQHYAPIVGHELQKFGKAHGREILHGIVNNAVAPSMTALSAYTGQPELMMATPYLQQGLNEGVDALGSKYGFGLRKHRGRPKKTHHRRMVGRALIAP